MMNNYRYIVFFMLITILNSCDFIEKKKQIRSTQKLIQNLQNMEIRIPESLPMLYDDSLYISEYPQSELKDYKIVTYIDASCSICVSNLMKWIVFLDTSKIDLNILFIVSIENMEFRQDSLNILNDFPYPLYIDCENEFIIGNNLPNDQRFHTMLLDSNYKAKPFGDPTFSKDIRNLYQREIRKIIDNDSN